MTPGEILNLLLGAGGMAFIASLYKVIKDFREGTWRRHDTAVADLERWRKSADNAREWAEVQHQWWRERAGRLEYVILTKLGASELPTKEPYPIHPKDPDDEQERRHV